MKTLKKLIITLLVLALAMPSAALAASEEIKVYVSGNLISFDQPPIIKNDRVMIPIRFVAETLGCQVDFAPETSSISITPENYNYTTAIFKVGCDKLLINKYYKVINVITLDAPPEIVGSRTLVPIRAAAEALGCTVEWDNDTKSVLITPPGQSSEPFISGGLRQIGASLNGITVVPYRYDSVKYFNHHFFATHNSIVHSVITIYNEQGEEVTYYSIGNGSTDFAEIKGGYYFYYLGREDRYYAIAPDGSYVLDGVDAEQYEAFRASLPEDSVESVEPTDNDSILSSDGLHYAEKKDDLYGLYDASGNEILSPRYENVFQVGSDMMIVSDGSGVYAVGFDGSVLIPPGYDYLALSQEGSAPVLAEKGSRFTYVRKDNTTLFNLIFTDGTSFVNGGAFVLGENNDCAVINDQGEYVVHWNELTSITIYNASLGYAPCTTPDGRYCFVDTKGNLFDIKNIMIWP